MAWFVHWLETLAGDALSFKYASQNVFEGWSRRPQLLQLATQSPTKGSYPTRLQRALIARWVQAKQSRLLNIIPAVGRTSLTLDSCFFTIFTLYFWQKGDYASCYVRTWHALGFPLWLMHRKLSFKGNWRSLSHNVLLLMEHLIANCVKIS